jgi:hypothetical protein
MARAVVDRAGAIDLGDTGAVDAQAGYLLGRDAHAALGPLGPDFIIRVENGDRPTSLGRRPADPSRVFQPPP